MIHPGLPGGEPKRPTLASHLAVAPTEILALPRDGRGYPIPWFVDMRAPQIDGNPDFRVMDGLRLVSAIREKRCWVCGEPLGATMAFVSGPMCGITRTSAEPPAHPSCAAWSACACPFLSQPKRIRNDKDLPPEHHMAGVGILRNPGVTMLWQCEGYSVARATHGGKGLLFTFGDPLMVLWLREGRRATKAEVLESIETGLPALIGPASKDGAAACFELGRMTERLLQLIPGQ